MYERTESIHTQVVKSAIVLFLAEITANILREEEPNPDLYNYFETSIKWFETHNTYSNFHLLFLIELTKYLGFYPELNLRATHFDLLEGKFQDHDSGIYCISGTKLNLLKTLLGIKFDGNKKLSIKPDEKRELLDMIILYFKLHLHGFYEPKSLAVLNQVFN
jgi:DNA repair protein RecO (recombination protein O)